MPRKQDDETEAASSPSERVLHRTTNYGITVPDLVRARFGDKAPLVNAGIILVVVISLSIVWSVSATPSHSIVLALLNPAMWMIIVGTGAILYLGYLFTH